MSDASEPMCDYRVGLLAMMTAEERATLAFLAEKMQQHKFAPDLKMARKEGNFAFTVDYPNEATGALMLMNAIGTADREFYRGFMVQLVNASSRGKEPDPLAVKFLLSVVKSIQPRDELEAMLAAQMAAVHTATMSFAHCLAHVNTIQTQDSAERVFNKLARTFAVQLEALKRYRTGGEQKVTVQHVTVNDGGQAIVGAVTTKRPGVGE